MRTRMARWSFEITLYSGSPHLHPSYPHLDQANTGPAGSRRAANEAEEERMEREELRKNEDLYHTQPSRQGRAEIRYPENDTNPKIKTQIKNSRATKDEKRSAANTICTKAANPSTQKHQKFSKPQKKKITIPA